MSRAVGPFSPVAPPEVGVLLRRCVALDDEAHRVAGEWGEADGPHVAEFLAEGRVHPVGGNGLVGLVGAGIASDACVREVDAVTLAFDGPDGDLVGP
jgi:hypothetical protein